MRKLLTILLTLSAFLCNTIKAQETFPVNGIHDQRKLYYAFTNASIYIDYKTRLDSATLLIRNGLVVSAGKNIKLPEGTVVADLKGKFIYPSFIDLFSDYGVPEFAKPGTDNKPPQFLSNTKGAYGWNQAIKPEQKAFASFAIDEKKAEDLRAAGFGTVLSHIKDGIARGSAVFVDLGTGKEQEHIIKDKAAVFYSFDKGSSTQDYPSSLMGSIALLRQTYLDALWYKTTGYTKEFNISLQAWNDNLSVPQCFEVKDKYSLLRAVKIADEFGQKYIIKGAGDEYQRIIDIKRTGAALIIPLNFPEPFDVADPYESQNISLAEMKHWELAPANAAALDKAEIIFAFTAADLKTKKDFLKQVRMAIDAGLSEETALKACTYNPAKMIGMENKSGSLKPGMLANFIITDKKIFDKDNVIYENWTGKKKYEINNISRNDIRGNYNLTIGNLKNFPLNISGTADNPLLNIQEDTAKIKINFSVSEDVMVLSFELKKSIKGIIRLNGSYIPGKKSMSGNGLMPDGNSVNWIAEWVSPYLQAEKKDTARKDTLAVKQPSGKVTYPPMAYGFSEMPEGKPVLIRNVTVWTNESAGILLNTDVLIQQGKIVKVAKNIDGKAIPGIEVIDGTGKHLTAGIIDEHAHIAIGGDVNECTQAITAEVRIGDVVDADDINIYRQLSGGVTSAHLLHGSCNPVGGQSQLIKLRWGKSPEQMKFARWDGFIKFALGENVKQSNWGDLQVTRYPQTRMGVEQTYINAFSRARAYDSAMKKFDVLSPKEKINATMPRRDLELEALAEILNKKRFITCHSYEQSEINMLMHVADSFDFKVNTFTHILEGYKVADKMKSHGAGASSFSDWWAYKYEVIEAIPHNGAILHDMGIVTAFNSDDAEMARRLNQEAAKAIKYGGVTEEEALKFVTLNPAKLLHVDDLTGSIKEGKDADVVLWTENPLSVYAKVVKTFVDGICYFDVNRDIMLRKENATEKARIVQKMIVEKNKGAGVKKPGMTIKTLHHCIDNENEVSDKSGY